MTPPVPPLDLAEARPEDAAPLAELGRRTFVETFAEANDPDRLEAFLAATYGEALQAEELRDPALTTLIARREGRPVGFAQLRRGPAGPGVAGPRPVELRRIYALAAEHGRGTGPALLSACLERARAEGFATLWLGVWEHNPRALAFYRRAGFREVGAQAFDLGGERQTDLVLALDL